ncbi:MAG: hypothetical protein NTX66_01710, partial [Candidatus Falkowbacteria bacterium]|nr:hypothetical protein [Candidatus Falkowbacteria bacterium]
MMILAALNVPAQRFQAMVGNGYGEQKGHGDLTYRFLELRWLPFLRNEQECKLGFFGNLTQVSSKIDGYVFNSLEKTIGLTLEYCPSSYSYYTDVYSWINVGYKFSEDSGGI